jgi:membrane dipeptidase
MPTTIKTFDGHNDVLLRLLRSTSDDPVGEFLAGGAKGHIDLPKAAAGHFVGGFFALYSPSEMSPTNFSKMTGDSYALEMPPALTLSQAQPPIFAMIATLMRLIRRSNGRVSLCTTTAEVKAAIDRQSLAVILHIEGADAIDEDLHVLEVLYAAGLRSLGPVWSRNNIFGSGVPFRFPAGPDLGDGLTEAGKRLVEACNDLKILIDLSHITEKGFFDVARLSRAPLVATHSNAHALCPSPRNLTDRQLDAIHETGGMVGLNFATCFLRGDGHMRPDTPIDLMVQQLDYLLEKVGEDHVGLGSDFDGAVVSEEIGSAAGLGSLYAALERRGYSHELLTKIGSRNWINVLKRTIG